MQSKQAETGYIAEIQLPKTSQLNWALAGILALVFAPAAMGIVLRLLAGH